MTTMTIAPAITGGQDPAFYAGRADAYDDHRAGTDLATLIVRLGYLIDDHPVIQYAAGYAARVWEIDREQRAVTVAELELAHSVLGGAR
ncbi:hypothetical protein ACFU98_29830 [Streptomyces sp. NPDC057575]|uniref:hypothetical protein n=1 Tax=unclassified Streptomyces TaxID=2593676 RepID=UPI00368E109C